MRRGNAESSDTFTAKQGFFDRTLALHTDRLGVSCRVQPKALIETGLKIFGRAPGALPLNGNYAVFPARTGKACFMSAFCAVCAVTHFSLARLCYHKDDCSSCRPRGCILAFSGPSAQAARSNPDPTQKENSLCL
jgi:hypothetical protein